MQKLYAICLALSLTFATESRTQTLFVDEASQSIGVSLYGLLWEALPVGQEFTPSLPWLDFVDLKLAYDYPSVFQVRIHEGTITGEVVATCAPQMSSADLLTPVTHFTFSNAVPLVPTMPYVLEVVHVNPPTDPGSAGYLARIPANTYPGGRAIWNGTPLEEEDLDFALGVLVPEILSSSERALDYYEEQGALLIARAARFTNDYIDYANGRNLVLTLRVFSGNASLGILGTPNLPGTNQPLYLNSGYVGTVTISPARLTIQVTFDTNATAAMVEEVIQQFYYTSTSQRPELFENIVSMKIDDGRASTELRFTVRFHNINDPPSKPSINIDRIITVLPGSDVPVVIARRGNVARVSFGGSGSDIDSTILSYTWRFNGIPGSAGGSRVEKNLRVGRKEVRLTVSDGGYETSATNYFEVINAPTAVRRLNQEVSASMEAQAAGLPRILRRAVTACALGRYGRAAELLEEFRTQLEATSISTTDPDLANRWHLAAYYIEVAIGQE